MTRSAWGVYGLLVLASVVYCLLLFSGLDHWGRGDWDQFTFRFETPRTAILRDGQLPLWNPYVNGGTVLAAHPHCPAFSPWYLLTLMLGAPLGLRVSVVLFVALGAVGMAALLRRWQVSPTGCFAGGVLLMMSAHFTMHVAEGHLEWCVMGLMPWVLLCLARADFSKKSKKEGWRFAVYGALVLASAVLYGSIYIVVVFVPLFCLWAVLEAVRTQSWRMVAGCAVSMALTLLLCAVALFPRIELLRANPRKTEASERFAAAALRRAVFDPGQANLFRATRDVRNPSNDELARIIPYLPGNTSPGASRPYETLKWHRLQITLATTSPWAYVMGVNGPHLWRYDGLDTPDETPVRLNSLPHGKGRLVLQGAKQGSEPITGEATLYVQLPEQGHLAITVMQDAGGGSKLTVACQGKVILDAVHGGDPWNASWKSFYIRRKTILEAGAAGHSPGSGPSDDAPWYRIDALLKTSSQWCRVEVANCPYLFHVELPEDEAKDAIPLANTALDIFADGRSGWSRPPGQTRSSLRASLYVRVPDSEDLLVAVTQGPTGTSTLTLCTPQGNPLKMVCREAVQPGKCKTLDYVLSGRTIREKLTPRPDVPHRWRLDELGMTYNWQEYGCYVTWLGLAMAALGMVVSFRRKWPLLAVGLIAGLIAMGAALPINVWALWRLLPMYGSLQVPSRFLAAVVFVAAVCAGFGIDRLGRWARLLEGGRLGGAWPARLLQKGPFLLEAGIALAIYLELATLGWSLFGEIFVCPKRPVPAHEATGFALRYAADDVRYAAMYSAHYPYLMDNSGVLREYENIAVRRGKIRLATDPDYRGEAYLEGSHGTAEIAEWTMSRVKVAVLMDNSGRPGARDRLVLNQNYYPGWKVICRRADGTSQQRPAEASPEGLVSTGVCADDREVEFYYLPGSFLWGAAVSGLTLAGCLGFLLVEGARNCRPGRFRRFAAAVAQRGGPAVRSKAFGYVASAVALNVPLLICHPGWTLADAPLVRSLAVNVVLFLAPGLPLLGAMIGRGWLSRPGLLWAMAVSLAVFTALIVGTNLAGWPVEAATVFNATWIVTNLGLLLNWLAGGPPAFGFRLTDKHARIGVLMFAVAYLTFFHAATNVVPVQEDHDLETQGTAYGMLNRLQMTMLTDRDTDYYFAHPPLAHLCVAGSFLYYGRLDELAYYDAAWNRVQAAKRENRFQPSDRLAEIHRLNERFDANTHHRLATRTPNVFLAALTVGLLASWITRMTGHGWLGLLIPLAYATSPQVFVRSAYGGYFAISNFALLQILLAVELFEQNEQNEQNHDRSRQAWLTCLLAGGFAAVANHKLLLLPAAIVTWEVIRLAGDLTLKRAAKAMLHPVVLGFAAGTALFWIYGLAVNAEVFWLEHVRHHLVDRIVHDNPLGYRGYPTRSGLWLELWQHTGYLLLPLGLAALGLLCWTGPTADAPGGTGGRTAGWHGTPGLWAVWTLLTAVAFTLIDWRQTKHLMPLLLPLHLAPARWAASSRTALVLVGMVFAVLLLWNLYMLPLQAIDFQTSPITPKPDW